MNLSFAGCGFLGIYHVGVAISMKQHAPHLLVDKISGASAGSLAAVGLLCDLPLAEVTSEMLRVSKEARSHKLGPFSPRFNITTVLLQGFEKYLPVNAHEMVNGKLHLSLTRVYDGKNVIVSHFNSREDLFQALLCACFIPVFSGILPPRFHGVRYMDGGFSDNLPTIDENTVTVSPFCGESDICPRDKSSQLFHIHFSNTSIELSKQNINRFSYVLMPPRAEILAQICQQGFEDGLRFLQRNNVISCNRCISIQSSFIVQEALPEITSSVDDEEADFDPECKDCTAHRKIASKANLPDTVVHVLQQAIETANKGLLAWLFRSSSTASLDTASETISTALPFTVNAEDTDPLKATKLGNDESHPRLGSGLSGMMIKWVKWTVLTNVGMLVKLSSIGGSISSVLGKGHDPGRVEATRLDLNLKAAIESVQH